VQQEAPRGRLVAQQHLGVGQGQGLGRQGLQACFGLSGGGLQQGGHFGPGAGPPGELALAVAHV